MPPIAAALGERADELAEADPPLPATRAIDELRAVPEPAGAHALPDSRLVRLAAAASTSAAVSGRLELYPRGLSAERALTLARGALLALGQAPPEAIARRVATRFPEAQPLPGRPELDRLLDEAGVELVWDAERDAYVPAEPALTGSAGIALHATLDDARRRALNTTIPTFSTPHSSSGASSPPEEGRLPLPDRR